MKRLVTAIILAVMVVQANLRAEDMDKMWGQQVMTLKAADAERGQLFEEGNYAMFIHWGLYSHIGNLYKGKNQPKALVSGRAGYGLGDYQTLGDMEVPNENVEGIWETVDTTNDSWAYAWYDNYWKTPREILHRLVACVGRGGTYMLNIGPRGDGTVPELAARTLRKAARPLGRWMY